ncbi:filamentous hemagglutinin (plasmid) [Brasilonema octagenarum UFV-E1]|uniref:Filamentous hemagglutinin n=2 Tax=Bromeliae group (in: Brasilonema) TaxID=3398495 RepID=A0A856MUB5_9CYAN|nr:filamentous hemagglutinin [Brasilonema sennae CENA114]QDL19262.1 filamentous hemagglutinin [Brasilonema octagenarum UFV-E1]
MWLNQKRVQLQNIPGGCRLLRINALVCKFFLRLGIAPWCALSVAVLLPLVFSADSTIAQELKPVADRTLGAESSVVTPTSPQADRIDGGAIRGANLFHSFSQFNIGEGREAYFANPSGIENILSRVTGSEASRIFGKLGVLGNANLFLINPNGIIFGKNASLDVRGSFVGTTANAIEFGNQGFFSATNPNTPPLLTVNPSAFFFNQIAAAPIQNNSIAPTQTDPAGLNASGLRVPDGKSLLLVGGNVSMDGGQLNANGGRVELGGLAEAGTVALGVNGDNLSLRFPENVARADVSLTNQAGIYVEGAGGGNIAVNARNLEILGGSVLSAGIGQGLGTPETVAGDITLNATGEIKVAGTGSIVSNQVRLGSKGNGGNIAIDSGSFSLQDRAQLNASTYGQGNAGNVTVRAFDTVSLAGNATILSTVAAGGVGKGGNININAATLSLTDGAQLATATREASNTQPAGRGDAGNVNVKVTGAVNIAGEKNGFASGIGSSVQTGAIGNAGNITIDSGSFSLQNGAILEASTFGQGNAGNVTVNALDAISLTDAYIFSRVGSGGVGKGGDININAATLSLTDGAQLQTLTRPASNTQPAGQGDAGNINVKVTGAVDIAREKNGYFSVIVSTVGTGTKGNAGNITIDSGSFSLREGAFLLTSTSGQGNAGNVTVNAKDAVSLAGFTTIFSTVGAGGVGKGGNININAATLSLTDGAQLQTLTDSASNTQPAGRGNAGNVNVKVTGAVDIAGRKNDYFSGIVSGVETGTIGNGGNITINSGSFSLRDGAQLSTSTSGQGDAGNVTVSALDAVSLVRTSILSTVEAGGVGKGGNIDIKAATLSLIDGTQLQTLTREASATQPAGRGDAGNVNVKVTGAVDIAGEKNGFISVISSQVQTGTVGNGGNITIDSSSFSLRDGAQLTAQTLGQGNAGTIKVNATDFVNISSNSSNGNRGLFVSSQSPTGTAGDIIVTSPRVTLDNSGTLNAESTSGNGGNINLNVRDLLLLRRGAQISTTAGNQQNGGDGGNITINAPNGFIVAPPKENSDITANAFTGRGGQVQINAQSIFGIQPRSQLTPQNDITASSELGISGTVQINTPDIDPTKGLVPLTVDVVDVARLVDENVCARTAKSSFTYTGRGGLPPSPNNTLNSDAVWEDWRLTAVPRGNSGSPLGIRGQEGERERGREGEKLQNPNLVNTPTGEIVEAQGWVVNANGDVILVADVPAVTPHKVGSPSLGCQPPIAK